MLTVGIGDNPLLAKLALDHQAKHDEKRGFVGEWRYEDVPLKVWKIEPLADFWGIAQKTEANLNRLGIRNIYDLSQYSIDKLKERFGVIGEQLFAMHMGSTGHGYRIVINLKAHHSAEIRY